MLKNSFILVCFTTLLGCSDSQKSDTGLTGIDSFIVTNEDIDSILKINGLPDTEGKRQDRVKEVYQERNAIASLIMTNELLDLPLVLGEIKRNRNELLIKYYFEAFVKNTASDEAIKKYYDEKIDEFTDKRAHVAQILVKVSPKDDINKQAELQKKAVKIADELRRGEDFANAVKMYSDDKASKEKGGDLGWLSTGNADAVIVEKAISLDIKDIPEPIRTAKGYHVIKLLEPIETNVKPFEDVKQKIAYKLKYDAKLNELKRLKKLAEAEVASLKS